MIDVLKITAIIVFVSVLNICSDELKSTIAAESGYKLFLKLCLSSEKAFERHGLEKSLDIETAELGKPISFRIINDKVLKNSNSFEDVESVLLEEESFLFPVLFGGQIKLLMLVRKYPGKSEYEIGALGYRGLAQMLELEMSTGGTVETKKVICYSRTTDDYLLYYPDSTEKRMVILDLNNTDFKRQRLQSGSPEDVLKKVCENPVKVKLWGN